MGFLEDLIHRIGLAETIFFIIGCHAVGVLALMMIARFLSFLYHYFIGHSLGCGSSTLSFGRWALVTGCTDGIGKAYARTLAEFHHNIILVSRNETKLDKLASELKQDFGIETKIVVADFAQGYEVYDEIRKQIQDIEIGILVNNVGTASEPYFFNDVPEREKYLMDVINVNILSCTFMISMVLPEMEKRGKGLILNLSSIGCLIPMPGISVYGATKSYVNYLSKSLQIEYAKKGIVIQSVLPGYVSTQLSKKPPSLNAPSPEKYVKSQLKTVGLRDYTYGYYIHSFTAVSLHFIASFPSFIKNSILIKAIKIKETAETP